MKTRFLIIALSIAIIATVAMGVIMMFYNDQLYEQNCADAYIELKDNIMTLQKTQFNTASSYVTDLDEILEIKKIIHELDCMSNPSQWIHLVTGTEKIKNPPQIVIERYYDVVNEFFYPQMKFSK